MKKQFSADFVYYNSIILELKAVSQFTGEHESQVLNYLKATNFKVGLLINFGAPSLEHKRFINFCKKIFLYFFE